MMMMTMMQRWACQRRHKQSTVHSIIDIDQNEARTDPRWVSLKYTKDFPSHVIQKSVSELHRYLSYLPSKSITGFEHIVLKPQNGKQETYNIR